MIRKEEFVPGEYYHIFSRTVLNIPEFEDTQNANRLAQRFLLSNSTESTKAAAYLRNNKTPTYKDLLKILKDGEKYVDILCYVIMPNHYHILVKELREEGIKDFVHKCNTSIAKYINTKKKRKGPLFESRFKSKHVDSNEYLLHLSLYIHLNPLDFLDSKRWRTHGLRDWGVQKEKLLDYPWSSLGAYLDENIKDEILSGQEIILDQFGSREEYEKFLEEWSAEDFDTISDKIVD